MIGIEGQGEVRKVSALRHGETWGCCVGDSEWGSLKLLSSEHELWELETDNRVRDNLKVNVMRSGTFWEAGLRAWLCGFS